MSELSLNIRRLVALTAFDSYQTKRLSGGLSWCRAIGNDTEKMRLHALEQWAGHAASA